MSEEMKAVKTALDLWITGVQNKDMTIISKAVVHDDDVVWIGGAESEWIVGYDALEQAMEVQNNALDNIRIEVNDETIRISPDRQVAWATSQWNFCAQADRQLIEVPLRTSWILEKREPGWVIVHFHKSVGTAE